MTEFKHQLNLISALVDNDYITLHLADGRVISVPLEWFPRVAFASPEDRQDFEILGGRGIAWFRLDEDLTVEQILNGQGACESEASFEAWRVQYAQGKVPRPFEFMPINALD